MYTLCSLILHSFLILSFVGCSKNQLSRVELEDQPNFTDDGKEYFVVIESNYDSAFTILFESLKYYRLDEKNKTLEAMKPFRSSEVVFPPSYPNFNQVQKNDFPKERKVGTSKRVPPLIHPSGYQLGFRTNPHTKGVYIIIRSFNSSFLANLYSKLLYELPFNKPNNQIYVVPKTEIKYLYYNQFETYKNLYYVEPSYD